jgi:putative hydroxymethylpyrimidine transport system substrate-binding protein
MKRPRTCRATRPDERPGRTAPRLRTATAAAALLIGLVTATPSLRAVAPAGAAAVRSPPARAAGPPAAGVSAATCAADRAAGRVTFVSAFGYDASAGILDVFAAQHLGYFADLCLDVSIVANAPSPPALVASGRAQVTGEGSAADTLAIDASGAHLVGVATFGDTSDYALLTSRSITKLSQLEGKTVAYHTTVPVILEEMLLKAGVDLHAVRFVEDDSYNPLLLVEGRYQGLQAYQSNEPLTLEALHEPFREWTPAEFGVHGTFNVQVVNAGFLRQHAAAVAAFLRAELHAFDYCLGHAVACVGFERAAAGGASDYDTGHELAEWRFESGLATTHRLPGEGIGVESVPEWRPEAADLVAAGVLKHAPDLAADEDPAIAASLYRGTTLVWP